MKFVRVIIMALVVISGTACSLWSKKEETPAEYLLMSANLFKANLKAAQEKEVAAGVRKVATRETFDKLQKEYKEAGDKEKPAKVAQLTAAQADYIYAQSAHVEAKGELTLARKAYVRKLILDQHPELVFTATPVPESTASITEQREEEQLIGVQHGDY
jgi:endonuclease/exonuclease/phosphatase (EEP) superfamily protein YafD